MPPARAEQPDWPPKKRPAQMEEEIWADLIRMINEYDLDKARAEEQALSGDQPADEDTGPKTPKQRLIEALKLCVPHVALIAALLTYLATGALIFIWIESDNEMRVRGEKRDNVTRLRAAIVQTVVETCQRGLPASKQVVGSLLNDSLLPLLHELSWVHEYQDKYGADMQLWATDEHDIMELWTFPTSVFYTLTVATSTGYERVSPRTAAGQIFTVCFGLFGIPLLFITAADIGKFMSEMVTRTYALAVSKYRQVKRSEAMKRKLETKTTASQNGYIQVAPLPHYDQNDNDEDNEIQMPFWAYFGLILGYCAGGSLMLNTIEDGTMWNFIYGFFFGFNAITTIGVGDINGRNLAYMTLIVAYVIIGLAVITMCIDLASSQVKMLFTKLHYFGRQFRGARLALSGEIQEALGLIAAMKNKNDVTLDDIITFLTVQEKLNRRPYIPRNVYFLKWIEDEVNNHNYKQQQLQQQQEKNSNETLFDTFLSLPTKFDLRILVGFGKSDDYPDIGIPTGLAYHYGVYDVDRPGVHLGAPLRDIDDEQSDILDISA